MHELSVAMSIIEIAQEESAAHKDARVLAVHLRLGPLCGVVKDALLSSYTMACAATPLEGSQLLIEEVPVEIFCPNCQKRQPVPSIQSMTCPDCGALSPEILRGRELEVIALELAE
jgi:hydrogenase nickel incorporation protein HypA/HybF